MSEYKLACVIILLYIKQSTCYHNATQQIDRNHLTSQIHGEVDRDYWQYKTQNLDELFYPRGNVHKLRVLESLWHEYYECCRTAVRRLTSRRQVPVVIVMVYLGAVARLPCSVCVAPNARGKLQWVHAEDTKNKTFKPIKDDGRIVEEPHNLIIYNVKEADAGQYQCQIGSSRSTVLVEVIDDQDYDVVKPATSKGPYATPPEQLPNGLVVFTSWSPWSECSVCGKVGRRRRYGMCHVKWNDKFNHTKNSTNLTEINDVTEDLNLYDEEIAFFELFPNGIPCRSEYLPPRLRLPAIRRRRSEIMIAMCKVPCNKLIFLVRTEDECIVELANNTAGIYSLEQILPKQPPMPVRDTEFVNFGQWVHIRCPGTTLRDVPMVWKSGSKIIMPRTLDLMSGGRVYLNSRDHLVITKVLYRDGNLYSCWQHEQPAGGVALAVRRGVAAHSAHRALVLALLPALLPAALALLRLAARAPRT